MKNKIILFSVVFSCIACTQKHKSNKSNKFQDVSTETSNSFKAEFKSDKAEHYYYIGDSLLRSGNFKEANKVLNKSLEYEPNNAFTLSYKSSALSRENLSEALDLMNRAIEIDSNQSTFYNNRGLIYYKMTKNNFALKDFTRSIQLDPSGYPTYINLGLTHYYLGNSQESCEFIYEGIRRGFNINQDDFIKSIYSKNCDDKF